MGHKEFARRLAMSVAELREANLGEIDPIRVSRLRKQFDGLVHEIALALDLPDDLRQKVEAVKRAASFHQLLWGTCRMLKDPSAYRRDAKKVGRLVEDLIEALEMSALQNQPV